MSFMDRITQRVKKTGPRGPRLKHDSALLDLHPELEGIVQIFRTGGAMGEYYADNFNNFNQESYTSRAWVRRAISVWADNISPLPVDVVNRDSKPLKNHPVKRVLDNPNPQMSPATFWEQAIIELGYSGEFGVEKSLTGSGKLAEIWPKQGQTITVKTGELGTRYREIVGYEIEDGEGSGPYNVPADQLIFYKFYNPENVFRGLSRIAAVRLGVLIDYKAQLWSAAFFNNSARPDYVIVTPEGTTITERQEIYRQLAEDHRGVGKSSKPIVLEQGVQNIKPLGFPPKDLAWVQQREMSRDEIGAIYGVPDEIMGYGKNTYENFTAADSVLWTGALKPLVRFRDDVTTHSLQKSGDLRDGERVQTDLTGIPQLREDQGDVIEQWGELVDRGVPPAVAAEFLNIPLPPYEGDTESYRRPAPGAGLIPAAGRSYRVHRFQETIGDPFIEERDLIYHYVEEHNLNSGVSGPFYGETKGPEYGSAEHKNILAAAAARIKENQADFERGLKRYFQDQEIRVLNRVRGEEGRALRLGRGKYKQDEGEEIPDLSNLFDPEEEARIFTERFYPTMLSAFEITGTHWWESLGAEGQFIIDEALNESVRYITNYEGREVNDSTYAELVAIITQAEEEGLGLVAVQENISAFFFGRKTDYQVERIARTSLVAADSAGAVAAWDKSEKVKTKKWISALQPNRTRDEHANAHNQEVGLNESFFVWGEHLAYPGDPAGRAENIINCLCTVIPGELRE